MSTIFSWEIVTCLMNILGRMNSLCAVRQTKPFWSAGVECYGWIQNELLRKNQNQDDHGDGLAVGKYEDDVILEHANLQ
ncbi:hypothetical protein PILCRDRAFT_810282 [Piloderma croceum F 1598]|uniref:Uncharacterized protein n=1 Tax=Piloderma croceum (strain F 1598) TaxID=765440 RepID=A0A0C3CRF6_PILCF|nr:hypothetical protein PILCRDRAFT_810282 [Piloderma croceum F 1598]